MRPVGFTFIFLINFLFLPLSLYASKQSASETSDDLAQSPEVQNFIRRVQVQGGENLNQNSFPLYFTPGSVDQKDYIRLLNIKRLLDERRAEIEKAHADNNSVSFERRLAFLTDLSLQVDGLSTQEGYIRYLSTPKGPRQSFWRRLAYMHHGLNLKNLSNPLKKYIVDIIWEGKWEQEKTQDWLPFSMMAYALREKATFASPVQIEAIDDQIEEITDFIAQIPFEFELNAFQELENLISSLLEIAVERHQYEQMSREWPWRLEELASEFWFSPRPLHATIALNYPDWESLGSPLMQLNEIYKNPALTGDQKFERAMEIVQAKAKSVKSIRIDSLFEKVKSLISAKKKSISSKIDTAASVINLPNVRFYIGLLNEYENLTIACRSLMRTIEQQRSGGITLDLVLQTISILSEAFNNIILPLDLEPSGDILAFRETLRYIRNKVNEHPDLLQTIQYKNFMKAQIFKENIATTIINNIVTQDFEIIKRNTLNRLNILRKIISAEEGWELLLSNIYGRFYERNEKLEGGKGKKITDPIKERTKWKSPQELLATDLWQDNGLPTLEGLKRYFFHPTYSLESVLLNDRTQLNLTANLIYGAELGWTIDHLAPINIETLKTKIQELVYFLPILLGNMSQIGEFQESLLSVYKEAYGDTELGAKREMNENLGGLDFALLSTPLWATAAFPNNIDDTELKYQILYRLISGVYEQLDTLIGKEGNNFFEAVQPRFRNLIRYLYQNLRIKRNFFAHDLWRVGDNRFSNASQACAKNIAKQIVSILWQALDKPENKIRKTKKPNQDGDLQFELDFISAVKDGNLDILKQKDMEFHQLNTSIIYLLQYGPEKKLEWYAYLNDNFLSKNKKTVAGKYQEILSRVLWYGKLYDPTLGVNFVDREGRTSFHYAAKTGSPKMITYLYESGGFPDLKDDSGRDVIDILEERLPKIQDKPTEREALQKILTIIRTEALLHGGEEHDEIYKKLKQSDIPSFKEIAKTRFSLNMYDASGNTLLTHLAMVEEDSSQEISQWLQEHGADSTIKPLIGMDQPICTYMQHKNGEVFFPNGMDEDPTHFLAHHERPIIPKLGSDFSPLRMLGRDIIERSSTNPKKGLDVVPIRPGYHNSRAGFGSAISPYTGTELRTINPLINLVRNELYTAIQQKLKEFSVGATTQEKFLEDYKKYQSLPWSPRWIAHFLEERDHSLIITKLPYIACIDGQEFRFNGTIDSSPSPINTTLTGLSINKATSHLKTNPDIRQIVIDDIINIFRDTKLPVGILYPRVEELYIKPNSIEIGFPDSILNNREISALRSRVSYLHFSINMLKKYIYLDNSHLPILANRDLVAHLQNREVDWKDIAGILQEYITNIEQIETTIKNYFMSSSLYNDFVDYFLQENRWLRYRETISGTLRTLAQFTQSTIYVWRQANEVGRIDLKLQEKIESKNSSNNWHFLYSNKQAELIPLTQFTLETDKSFEHVVEDIFKTSVYRNHPATQSEPLASDGSFEQSSSIKVTLPAMAFGDHYLKLGGSFKEQSSNIVLEIPFTYQRTLLSPSTITDKEQDVKTTIQVEERGLTLLEIPIVGDGDCGYHALGLSRQEASDMLLSAIDQEEIRDLIAPEIEDHFPTLPEKMKEDSEYQELIRQIAATDQELTKAVDEARQALISELHDVSTLPPEELFQYMIQLEKPSANLIEIQKKLNNSRNQKDNLEEKKKTYCRKKETVRAYIENFISISPTKFAELNPELELNYIVFSPGKKNGLYRTSAGDTLAHILGKNLIVIDRNGTIIHEYKKGENFDTLYLIQESIVHYNKGEIRLVNQQFNVYTA